MELGTNERPDYPKPEPEDGESIDYSKDGSQGCRHYSGETGNVVTGYPSTTEPKKTWLDECAFEVLAAIVSKYPYCVVDTPEGVEQADKVMSANVRGAYRYADAMLAEKMKREAKDGR